MKIKLVSVLTVISIFFVTGLFVFAAAPEPLDNTGTPVKTVAINNFQPGQSTASPKQGGVYDQIMKNQEKMKKKMSKMFDDPFFGSSQKIPPAFFGAGMGGSPQKSFDKKENAYVLQLAIPGIDKKNIKIDLHGYVLTVSTKNSDAAKNVSNNQSSYQQYSKAFTQPFNIPLDVDTAKITSNYKNGVLTIKLPKDADKADQKAINISVD